MATREDVEKILEAIEQDDASCDGINTSTREINIIYLGHLSKQMREQSDHLKNLSISHNKLHTRMTTQEKQTERVLHVLEGNGQPGLIKEHNECKAERAKITEYISEQKRDAQVQKWIKYGVIALLAGLAAYGGGRTIDGGKLDRIEKALEKLEVPK